jgi:Di-glucose binding within endoplasmic reticulum.
MGDGHTLCSESLILIIFRVELSSQERSLSQEAERKELEVVLANLERMPRVAALLRYMAGKYFEGDVDELTEYNIATEVFGRGKTSFIASDDAIARVETHRLRKRLKDFYETKGKNHPVRISLPLGTYVPVFTHQPPETAQFARTQSAPDTLEALEPDASAGSILSDNGVRIEAPASVPEAPSRVKQIPATPWYRQVWIYLAIAAVLAASAFGVYKILQHRVAATGNSSAQSSISNTSGDFQARRLAGAASVSVPFRMIAGYSGPPQRDVNGDLWLGDKYFRNGWALNRAALFFARANNPLMFRYGRAGDFSYDIPLRPGTYELHLHFLQASMATGEEDAENTDVFNVRINEQIVLKNFDIVSDAMGQNTADERVFRDVSPASDGFLHLRLSTVQGTPSISAIQILEGTPHRQLPIRIVTQHAPYTDHKGQLWTPDNYYLGGRNLSHYVRASAPVDQDLFYVERYGHFSYAFPVDPRDRYTVVLHFEELFLGTSEMPPNDHDSRIFRVMCNGDTVLDNFNIYQEVGSLHPVQKSFSHIKPTSQGKLNLTFEPISNYATVSAIEVIDESN